MKKLALPLLASSVLLLLASGSVSIAPVTRASVENSCVPAPPGMVSWWPGDGNANDIKGSNNGTLQNGATFAPGMVGQAFSLDGVDDHVEIADNPTLNTPTAITLDAWVKPNAIGEHIIVSKYDTSASGGGSSWALLDQGTGRIRFEVGRQSPGFDRTLDTNNPALTVGVWQHVAATFDTATQEMKIYLNGEEVPSTLIETGVITTIFDSTSPVRIGAYLDGANRLDSWDGLIDEVELFDRALTASEIQDIFNAGSAGKCKGIGPPTNKDQCKNGGWMMFNFPRAFKNQGDCIQFVNTGK